MRVVRIQSRICVGGPALHSILLTEGLSHRAGSRYDTVLLSGALEPGEGSMESFAAERGVRFQVIPEMRRAVRAWDDAVAVARITRILRRLKPHIVHTHTAKAGAIGRAAARAAGVPIVLHTFHGHVFDGYFSRAKTEVFLQVERALAKMTDQILAISNQQREDLVDRYRIAPADKVRVVPLGLDLSAFRSLRLRSQEGVLRKELGIDADAPVIVTVGRLVPIKRFDLLIEAFRSLDVEAHLVVVGEGECRAELETLAEKHPRIHFTGLRRDLPDIYRDADLMVLSSDNEGTPVAVIEALASGVPVVATDVGGVRDIMAHEDMGTIVPPGQIDSLAAAMSLRLQQSRRLDDALRDDIHDRYSHLRLLSDMESLYDRLVAERLQGMPTPFPAPAQGGALR